MLCHRYLFADKTDVENTQPLFVDVSSLFLVNVEFFTLVMLVGIHKDSKQPMQEILIRLCFFFFFFLAKLGVYVDSINLSL